MVSNVDDFTAKLGSLVRAVGIYGNESEIENGSSI